MREHVTVGVGLLKSTEKLQLVVRHDGCWLLAVASVSSKDEPENDHDHKDDRNDAHYEDELSVHESTENIMRRYTTPQTEYKQARNSA